MSWNMNADRPIYAQIVEKLQMDIVSGAYQPGDKLPSVRELAADAAVNPNTMQKAFGELERTGLVYTQRTSGRFITEDYEMIDRIKTNLAKEKIEEFFTNMKKLGYEKEETAHLIEAVMKEEKS